MADQNDTKQNDIEQNNIDQKYMRMALELAKKGTGRVSPNPLVGAVLVKNGEVIGSGYHERYGEAHAERNALASCTESPEGATLYVTLEPCCHYGKQPPCTEAIAGRGIRRVFVGSADPNPLVAGKGIEYLKEHGIEVTEGVLQEECDSINEIFFHYITTGLPFVTMKYAMTIDGKIACYTGKAKWLTGEESRLNAHCDRLKHSAIMAGIGTVLADDPLLTCRLENARNPIRIICDSRLRTPLDSNIVKTANEVPTLIVTACTSDKTQEYEKFGCEVIFCADESGKQVDLVKLMKILGERKIDSILLEGGSTLNWSALNSGIVNKVQAYIAPKIFGGKSAPSPVGGIGTDIPDNAFMLEEPKISHFGNDIMIESRVKYVHGNN